MIPQDYRNYLFCKEMGWTYWDLMSTPAEVVRRWWGYMNAEARAMQRKGKG